MQNIRTDQEIRERIRTVEDRLSIIDHGISKELERPFFERRINTCQFLDLEKKIYSTLLKELKWVLHE